MNHINVWGICLKLTPQNNNISILCTFKTLINGELAIGVNLNQEVPVYYFQYLKPVEIRPVNQHYSIHGAGRLPRRNVQGNGWWIYFSQRLQERETWMGSNDRGLTHVHHRVNISTFLGR